MKTKKEWEEGTTNLLPVSSPAGHLGKEFDHLLGIPDLHLVRYRNVDLKSDVAVLVLQEIGHALTVHALHDHIGGASCFLQKQPFSPVYFMFVAFFILPGWRKQHISSVTLALLPFQPSCFLKGNMWRHLSYFCCFLPRVEAPSSLARHFSEDSCLLSLAWRLRPFWRGIPRKILIRFTSREGSAPSGEAFSGKSCRFCLLWGICRRTGAEQRRIIHRAFLCFDEQNAERIIIGNGNMESA